MIQSLRKTFKKEFILIEKHLHQSLSSLLTRKLNLNPRLNFPLGVQKLFQSMSYSLFSRGKRFRPLLSLLTAQCLKKDLKYVLPFSSALEMVHTYSLIHDDLPCMDDSPLRRGKKANHRVFGEAVSVLSGNALLTEAFSLLARSYSRSSRLGLRLIEELSKAIGVFGMMGGQGVDMEMQRKNQEKKESKGLEKQKELEELREELRERKEQEAFLINPTKREKKSLIQRSERNGKEKNKRGKSQREENKEEERDFKFFSNPKIKDLSDLHLRKTGALIEYSLFGSALILKAQTSVQRKLKRYGSYLGLAFQVADDLLDRDQADTNQKNGQKDERKRRDIHTFPDVIGLEETKAFLERLTKLALSCIPEKEFALLRQVTEYNRSRIF